MSITVGMMLLVVAATLPAIHEALKVGFYSKTCPTAEALVRQAVAAEFASNPRVAPGLVRMHFHDCFVRGCDASVLLDGNGTEKTAIPNQSLHGFEVIDAAKAAIEATCPRTVSCADILAFAARDSSSLAGNITWSVPAGRRDGSVSIAAETTDLPPPSFNASQLVANFAKKNLTADEMVTLSGAHSFGVSHCAAFLNRIYNTTTGAPKTDPTLSLAYANLLRNTCPPNVPRNSNITVLLDLITPDVLDNKYYVGVLNNLGLFISDHALVTESHLLASVLANAERQSTWADKFAKAMVRMGNIEVLEGAKGEIRTNCRVVNPKKTIKFAENDDMDVEIAEL